MITCTRRCFFPQALLKAPAGALLARNRLRKSSRPYIPFDPTKCSWTSMTFLALHKRLHEWRNWFRGRTLRLRSYRTLSRCRLRCYRRCGHLRRRWLHRLRRFPNALSAPC